MPGTLQGSVCHLSIWNFPGKGGARFCPRFFCSLVNGISLFAVERENVQKRTFTRWINLHLEKASGGLGVGK